VGNGEEGLFWKDRWWEGETIYIRFNRLFELAINKNIRKLLFRPPIGLLGRQKTPKIPLFLDPSWFVLYDLKSK
jgi:hypothetical protein